MSYSYADLPDTGGRYVVKPGSPYRSTWYGRIFEFLNIKTLPLNARSALEFNTLDSSGWATGLIFRITFKEFKEHMMPLEVGNTVKLKASDTKYTVESVSKEGGSAILKHPSGYTIQLPQDEIEGGKTELFFEMVRRANWSSIDIRWNPAAKAWRFHINNVGFIIPQSLRELADYLDKLNAIE